MTTKCFQNVIAFTDGSCIRNGTKFARGGVGIHFPNKEFDDVSMPFTVQPITNQRAELCAILTTLDTVTKHKFTTLTIYTDSEYSIKCLTLWAKKWDTNCWIDSKKKSVKNQDLIRPAYEILKRFPDIRFKHVRSPTGGTTFNELANEKADILAKAPTIPQKTE